MKKPLKLHAYLAVVGDGSINILPSIKDSQLNTLKGICDIDLDSEKISVKKR